MSLRRWAALRWVIAVAIIVVVLSRFDLAAVGTRLSSVDWRLASAGIAALVAIHLVGALSWRRLLDRLAGIRLDWPLTIRLYYAAQAVGSITPGNIGADVYRVVAVDAEAGRGSVALPIVVQRVTSIGALLVLGGLGALVLPVVGGAPLVAWIGLVPAGLAATVAILVTWARWRGQSVAWLVRRFRVQVGELAAAGAWASVVRDGFGLGLVFHGASLGLGLLLVAAVDPATAGRSVEVLAALAIARLSLAVPISPNGLGLQEGALGILFVQLGLEPNVALAAILLNRVALVVAVLLGAISLLTGPRLTTPARASIR
jgi:uncharacterized membrane protein YbhN (UPF0104 family)